MSSVHIHIHQKSSKVKDAADPLTRAKEATVEANAATRKATVSGTPDNHYMAGMKHEAAAKWWKAAGNTQKEQEHLRQAQFHFRNHND